MRKTTIKLPISGNEIEISAPTVRVMKMAGFEKTDEEKGIKICASCSNLTIDEVENLDMLDFNAIEKVIQDFLSPAVK